MKSAKARRYDFAILSDLVSGFSRTLLPSCDPRYEVNFAI